MGQLHPKPVNAYDEIVFVSDGAVWIWNLVQKYFPNVVQIVDWYHASEYLTPIAEAAFGTNTPQAHEWLTQTRSELWEGRIQDGVIATAKARASWLSHSWDSLKPIYSNLPLAS